MFREKYIVWYFEEGNVKFMEFDNFNCCNISSIFTEEEIIKIEVVLED